MKINDISSGILLLFFSVVLWIAAQELPNPASQVYGPAFFPTWIAVGMGVSAVVMIFTSLSQYSTVPFALFEDWLRDPRRVAQFLLVPISVVFYVYTVEYLGFLLTAVIVLSTLQIALGVRIAVAAVTTAAMVAIIYGIFDVALHVPLPRGTLFLG